MYSLEDRNRVPLKEYYLDASVANWTTVSSIGIPYQTISGAWRLKFNISGTLSVASATVTLVIAGVAFTAIANGHNACAAWSRGGATTTLRAVTIPSSNTLGLHFSATETAICVSGDVELASKPTFME